ncbi:MAG: GntR family transcriptional regulator [Bacteroidetes bacterium]|nr:GntR family transcriptional regulator [Bacteroidota bacterium]
MIQIGKTNTLNILRETAVGLHLGDEDKNEVLLPNSYIKSSYKVKDQIEVFIYKDSEDRLIATPQIPYAEIYSFAFLRVTSITEVGAFLDWGLEKDLFLPYREQKNDMQEGESYVVYIYLDEETDRIIASAKVANFISNEHLQVEVGDEVDLIVFEESPLGFSCIIDRMHRGLMYRNDIYKDIQIGDELKGYIKNIRQDNLIDLSLQKSGFQNVLSSTDIILEYLDHNNGYLNLTDKSTPEEIAKQFAMSKATFKKSIGVLYRHRKVLIKDDGVYLVKEEDRPKNDKAE